jgi:glucosyl-3-phosphoglycerate synthase
VGPGIRTFHHRQADPLVLARAKGRRRVSVCIPARDEAATVGAVVAAAAALSAAHGGPDLVDEVVVVDDRSADDTAAIARAAGARVLTASEDRPSGKGGAMRRALDHTDGDLVVFLDADVENPGPHFVAGLLLPLLTTDGVVLVKGCYDRPLHGRPGEGGRVTELTARPVLSLLFPEVAEVRQPLAGETAAPRWVLDKVDLADGYGVEIALLLDVAERFGPSAIAQVDLGVRVHRNRPLTELGAQAREVLAVALARAGVLPSSDDAERSATADPLDDLTRPVDRTANRSDGRPA